MQKVHRLYLIINTIALHTFNFRLYFTTFGSFHLSFTVLLHYRLIKVFKIRRWFSFFQTKFHRFCCTFFLFINYKLRDYHLIIQRNSTFIQFSFIKKRPSFFKVLRLKKAYFFFRVHSPLLTKSFLISFLLATKMFQFTNFFFKFPLRKLTFIK